MLAASTDNRWVPRALWRDVKTFRATHVVTGSFFGQDTAVLVPSLLARHPDCAHPVYQTPDFTVYQLSYYPQAR